MGPAGPFGLYLVLQLSLSLSSFLFVSYLRAFYPLPLNATFVSFLLFVLLLVFSLLSIVSDTSSNFFQEGKEERERERERELGSNIKIWETLHHGANDESSFFVGPSAEARALKKLRRWLINSNARSLPVAIFLRESGARSASRETENLVALFSRWWLSFSTGGDGVSSI